jgi:hypothetical protein
VDSTVVWFPDRWLWRRTLDCVQSRSRVEQDTIDHFRYGYNISDLYYVLKWILLPLPCPYRTVLTYRSGTMARLVHYRMNFESIFFIKMMPNRVNNLTPVEPKHWICLFGEKFDVSLMIKHSRPLSVHSMEIGVVRHFWKFMIAIGNN